MPPHAGHRNQSRRDRSWYVLSFVRLRMDVHDVKKAASQGVEKPHRKNRLAWAPPENSTGPCKRGISKKRLARLVGQSTKARARRRRNDETVAAASSGIPS